MHVPCLDAQSHPQEEILVRKSFICIELVKHAKIHSEELIAALRSQIDGAIEKNEDSLSGDSIDLATAAGFVLLGSIES